MKVLIIIPMYGQASYTHKCIRHCYENAGMEIDILVVDDGSPEPFKHNIANVIRIEKNQGYTNAVNEGIIWANGCYDYICLLNNDTEPGENFIKNMVEVAESDKSIGIVSPARIENRSGILIAELDQIDILRGYHNTILMKDLKDEVIDCKAVAGACYLIPSRVLTEVGLLDKTMPMFCTDTDYGFRVILAGYRIVVATKARIFHHHSVTVKACGIDADKDMKKFLEKYSGFNMNKIFSQMPLDMAQGTYGQLNFNVVKK